MAASAPAALATYAEGKVTAIQLLRALAALTVAVLHIGYAFADNLGAGLGLGRDTGVGGQAAVMLFFIISGYVMVISARGLFGRPGARRWFWVRRLTRIMPPYWLASGLLAVIFLTIVPQPIDPLRFAQSLALIPFWPTDGSLRAVPFLWVGWTLLFELVFYFWFGLFIGWPRPAALGAVAGVLTALVVIGLFVPPESAALFTVTRPVSLMFMAGMALAVWRERGGRAAMPVRLAAVAALALALALVPKPPQETAMGFDYLLWCGLPSLLLAFAVLSGRMPLPWPRLVNRAGDISYALYLLHVPVAWGWLWLWPKLCRRLLAIEAGPWDYLLTALLATLIAAGLFYAYVERPLTAALNRRLLSPHLHSA